MNLIVRHVSEDGKLRNKEVTDIYDVTYDIGFEKNRENVPAVKLHVKGQNAYYLLEVYEPEILVKELKLELHTKILIEIPADIFDQSVNTSSTVEALMYHLHPKTLNQVFSSVGLKEIFHSDAWKCFSSTERKQLINKDLTPLKTRNVAKLAELWRRTLPTPHRPQGVSKLQYFETLIESARNMHPHAVRTKL